MGSSQSFDKISKETWKWLPLLIREEVQSAKQQVGMASPTICSCFLGAIVSSLVEWSFQPDYSVTLTDFEWFSSNIFYSHSIWHFLLSVLLSWNEIINNISVTKKLYLLIYNIHIIVECFLWGLGKIQSWFLLQIVVSVIWFCVKLSQTLYKQMQFYSTYIGQSLDLLLALCQVDTVGNMKNIRHKLFSQLTNYLIGKSRSLWIVIIVMLITACLLGGRHCGRYLIDIYFI